MSVLLQEEEVHGEENGSESCCVPEVRGYVRGEDFKGEVL